MRTTSYHRLHWQQRMLLIGLMLICIFAASSSSFQPTTSSSPQLHLTRSCNKKSSSSALAYAGTSSAAGPMSQVDPNARSGGCPFLVKSHDAHVTYAPALCDNNNNNDSNQQQQKKTAAHRTIRWSMHTMQQLCTILTKV
jgi:hypothetical protein